MEGYESYPLSMGVSFSARLSDFEDSRPRSQALWYDDPVMEAQRQIGTRPELSASSWMQVAYRVRIDLDTSIRPELLDDEELTQMALEWLSDWRNDGWRGQHVEVLEYNLGLAAEGQSVCEVQSSGQPVASKDFFATAKWDVEDWQQQALLELVSDAIPGKVDSLSISSIERLED